MQQTEKLKLNLVEDTDKFSQEPLNENMKLLDENVGRLEAEVAKKGTCTAVADTFEGDGSMSRDIELGFAPVFAIMYGDYAGTALGFAAQNWGFMFRSGMFYSGAGFKLTENGFHLTGGGFNKQGTTTYYATFS